MYIVNLIPVKRCFYVDLITGILWINSYPNRCSFCVRNHPVQTLWWAKIHWIKTKARVSTLSLPWFILVLPARPRPSPFSLVQQTATKSPNYCHPILGRMKNGSFRFWACVLADWHIQPRPPHLKLWLPFFLENLNVSPSERRLRKGFCTWSNGINFGRQPGAHPMCSTRPRNRCAITQDAVLAPLTSWPDAVLKGRQNLFTVPLLRSHVFVWHTKYCRSETERFTNFIQLIETQNLPFYRHDISSRRLSLLVPGSTVSLLYEYWRF